MASKGRFENVMKSYLSSDNDGNGGQSSGTLDKFLRCMICSGYYKEPRLFPCGHSACANCVNEYIRDKCHDKHISCPACKTSIECKPGGASDFPKSNLLSTLSQLQQQQASGANQICEFCKQSEDKVQAAGKFCTECTHFLCNSCADNHNRTMLTRNHQLIDAGRAGEHLVHARSRSQMCSEHRDKQADLCCKRCDKVVCQICALVAHRQHQIVDMPSIASQVKLDLQKTLVDLDKRVRICEKYERQIDEVNKKNERLQTNLADNVNKWAQEVKRRVDAIADKMKEQLGQKSEQVDQLHHLYAEKVSDRLELFRGLHDCIGELLRVGTANELYHLSADVKGYLQLIDGGAFNTGAIPALQVLCLNDRLLTNAMSTCEAISAQMDADERSEPLKVEELHSANEEPQRLKIVSTVKYQAEVARASRTWFSTKCKSDTQKVQIRAVFYQDEKRTFLVGDIWNRCIKEFNEKGVFQNMWSCRLGWPIALVETKNKNIACVEYDIGLRQCSLVLYGMKGQVQSTVSLNFSGMYIGSIALSNENHIIIPNHDERKVCLYGENTKLKPVPIAVDGRPEFVAYIKTSSTTMVACPNDQVVFLLKGEHVMKAIRASDLGTKSWRPYCVAASVSDARFVVHDGFHPDQDRLLVFDEAGTLTRVLPQDRVWIRVYIDACNRLVLCDKQNVAVYTCSWLQVAEKNASPKVKSAKKNGRDKCAAHPKKAVEVYCEDCEERICQLCTMLKHNGHSLVDLTTRESTEDDDSLRSGDGETASTSTVKNEQDPYWFLLQDGSTSEKEKQTAAGKPKSKTAFDDSIAFKHLFPVKDFPYKWKLYDGDRLLREFKTHKGEPAAALVTGDKILAVERISEIQSVAVFYSMEGEADSFVDMKNGLNPSNILFNQDLNLLVPGGGETAVFLYSGDCQNCLAQHQFPNILPEFIAYSAASNCVAVSFPSELDPYVSLTFFADTKLANLVSQTNLTSKQIEEGSKESWTPRALCFVADVSGESLWVFDETSRRIMQFSSAGKWMRTVMHNIDDCEYLYPLGVNKALLVGRRKIQAVVLT